MTTSNQEVVCQEYQVQDPKGTFMQVWAVLFNGRLFNLAFASAPNFIMHTVEFSVARTWL